MDHCSLTQEKIRVTKCAVLSPCAHAFDVTAFVLYCAKSKSPSGCVTCPNCRQPVKGVLNDRRGPYELVGERTVIFKHGKILFNLVLPLSSPQEDDDELIRNFLCIARGRIKFLGKKVRLDKERSDATAMHHLSLLMDRVYSSYTYPPMLAHRRGPRDSQ